MAKSFPNTGVTTGLAADRTALTSPFEGQFFYETDTNKVLVYNGSSWIEISDLDSVGGLSTAVADSSKLLKGVMPVGSIIQVVEATMGASVTTSGTTEYTLCTVNITPNATSNKIWVFGHARGSVDAGTTNAQFYIGLWEGSTERTSSNTGISSATDIAMPNTVSYLASPNTTSQVSFVLKGSRGSGGTNNVYIEGNDYGTGRQARLIAMEIVA